MTRTQRSKWWWSVGILFVTITVFHYTTSIAWVDPHTIYRRLYYIPVVLAAFAGGVPGAMAIAGVVTLAYLPHAFLLPHHLDPSPAVDKILEMVLYFGVGGLTGWLVDRERAARQREQEAALRRAEAETVARRLEAVVHLSRGLAHEIRNPLGGIQGAIEIIAEDVPEDSPRRDMVDVALRETARLDRVLRDFLDFARPRPPRVARVRIGDIVGHVVALLAGEAEAAGITLGATGDSDLEAMVDRDQMVQVLVNIVRNAIQVTPEGGRVEVVVLRNEEGSPVVEVRDTGPGIPPELGDTIYDPYVSTREDGTGLGLCLSTVLARSNRCQLVHRPRPGGGTIFELVMPVGKGVGS